MHAPDALLLNLREWGVMLRRDAETRYGPETVVDLLREAFLQTHDTPFGGALSLAHKGRRRVGFVGRYQPEVSAVLNALAVRDAKTQIEAQSAHGLTTITPRLHGKYMFTVTEEGGGPQRAFVVAARYTGFDFRAVRLLYRRLFVDEPEPPLPSGLLVFVPPRDVPRLRDEIAPKKIHRPFLIDGHTLDVRPLPRERPQGPTSG